MAAHLETRGFKTGPCYNGGAGTFTASFPTGLVTGDLLLLMYVITNTNGPHTVTTPSGWTAVDSVAGVGYGAGGTFWKVATSGDVSAGSLSITKTTAANDGYWTVMAFKVGTFHPTAPVTSTGMSGTGSGYQWYNGSGVSAFAVGAGYGVYGIFSAGTSYYELREPHYPELDQYYNGMPTPAYAGWDSSGVLFGEYRSSSPVNQNVSIEWNPGGGSTYYYGLMVVLVHGNFGPLATMMNTSTSATFAARTVAGVWTTQTGSMSMAPPLTVYPLYPEVMPFRAGMSVRIRRDFLTETLTGREKVRIVLCTMAGVPIAELHQAVIGSISWVLNGDGGVDFSLPADDPKIASVVAPAEVQVWKGDQLIWWGIVTRLSGGDAKVQFQAEQLGWYLKRTVVGLVPTPNLLTNGSFDNGYIGWDFGWIPGSAPAAPPEHSLTTQTLNGPKALQITGSDKAIIFSATLSAGTNFYPNSPVLLPGGEQAVRDIAANIPPGTPVHVEGHTANDGTGSGMALSLNRANAVAAIIHDVVPSAIITTVGYGYYRPIADNSTEAGRKQNRRAVINYVMMTTAKGHRQFVRQRIHYLNPSSKKKKMTLTLVGWCNITDYIEPSKDGWGVVLERFHPSDPSPDADMAAAGYTKSLDKAYVAINNDTPRNRWTRMECSIEIPADDVNYPIDIRLYPPAGTCIWDEIGVTAADQLGYFDVDEAQIVEALVQHAQDPAMSKSNKNLLTHCPPTGIVRTREYPFNERKQISECIAEFPTLADGVDVDIVVTPQKRVVTTYFPRQGIDSPIVLASGVNIRTYSVQVDSEQVSTQIIVQAEGDGSDREEGVARNTALVGPGLVLEKVYNATPGSAISSLNAQAERGLRRYARPVVIPSVTMRSEFTDELLDTVHIGDRCRVRIKQGWINVDQQYRISTVTFNPDDYTITFDITPEDI